jgi:hypothetical protein
MCGRKKAEANEKFSRTLYNEERRNLGITHFTLCFQEII